MPQLVQNPVRVPVPGGKVIDEYVGRVTSGTQAVSVAHMSAPAGWDEPAQTPDFDEVTVVLAGTVRRTGLSTADERAATELLGSHKDREEHDYAVASLVDRLSASCLDVAAAAPSVLELANVLHLSTDVTATVADGSTALDLVAAVHPTAAVGGTPTADAVALIRSLEGMDRGRYAGPVGWLDARGDGEWGIALRCAEVDGRTVRLFAGCGIVAESDPDDEVAEAQAKFLPIRDALEG